MKNTKKNISKPTCLFLLDRLGVGGSERKTIVAANCLAEQGYSIYMCFLNVSYDVSNTLHPTIKYLNLNRMGKLDFSVIKNLKDFISANKIEVIWAVNLYPTLYMYLSAKPYRNQLKLIGSSNITVFRNRYERIKMYIYAPIIRSLDVFVFGSVKQRKIWENQYHLNARNTEIVHNGVDVKHFSVASVATTKSTAKLSFGFSANDFVVGMVAQFRPEKAYKDLIRAGYELMQSGCPLKLLLVGCGPEEQKIRELVADLKMEGKVFFSGQLDDVRTALIAMDVFALTSTAVETFSNAALEAMSMGLPAVLSNIGGAEEMVEHGVNGYVYTPGNTEELALCIKKLTDEVTLEILSISARKIVVEKFSAKIMAHRYDDIIEKV